MTAGDTVTVFLYSFNARRCPFQTNVNQTFCPAQPKLMGHLEKLIGLCPTPCAIAVHTQYILYIKERTQSRTVELQSKWS